MYDNDAMEDMIKTNIRITREMKEQFKQLAGDMDLQDMLEYLVIQYNKAWQTLGFEKMFTVSLENKTNRKVMNNGEREKTAKDQIITLKTKKDIYEEFKANCDKVGIVFGEGIRRMLNQAINTNMAAPNFIEYSDSDN